MPIKNNNLVAIVVGKALQIIIMLISIRIMTSILSEKEVGQNYLLLTILSLLNFVFWGPVSQFFSRKTLAWNESRNLNNVVSIMFLFRCFTALISLFIAYTIYYVSEYERYYTMTEFLTFIFISSVAIFSLLLLSTINMLGKQVLFTKLNVLLSILTLTLSVLIVRYIDDSAMSWLYGVAVSQIIMGFPLYIIVVNKQTFNIKKSLESIKLEQVKALLIFSAPITVTLFLQWGQNFSYRFMVEANYSIELLGMMGVGLAISTAIFSAVDNVACQFFNPIYFKGLTQTKPSDKMSRAKLWNLYSLKMFSIYVSTLIFIISTAPFLLKILVSEKFHNVYIFVMAGAVVEFCRVCCNAIYMISQSELKTKSTIIPYAIGYFSLIIMLSFLDLTNTPVMVTVIQALSYAIIILILFKKMSLLLSVNIDFVYLLKLFFTALPLAICLCFPYNIPLIYALAIVAFAGMYFIFILYTFVYKLYLRESL
jgi:O-antigen/teichoic acid export membrane protein